MMVLFVLMYKKNVISLGFHEIAGLIVLGISLIHVAFNYKWVVGITKRLFDRTLSGKTRFQYLVNILLVVNVVMMLISSIMISKIVFPTIGGDHSWTSLHYFFAATLVALIGIHFGLHFTNIKNRILGNRSLHRVSSVLFGILMVTLIAFGAYTLATGSYMHYLTGVFNTGTQNFEHTAGAMPPSGDFSQFHGGEIPAFSFTNLLSLFLGYFSIMTMIGSITHLGSRLLAKRRTIRKVAVATQV